MKKFSKKIRTMSFAIALTYALSTTLYAEVLTGKIENIQNGDNGQIEVTLVGGQGKQTVILTRATAVESNVPARKIKIGAKIYLPGSNGGGSRSAGHKGLKSPFKGIPNSIKKSAGLPDMPETPDIPGVPEVPKAPKVPKVPSTKKPGGEAPAAAGPQEGGGGQGRSKTQPPPAQESTAEERNLYGKADSNAVAKGAGESEASVDPGRKVLQVHATDKDVKLELERPDGKNEQVTLQPENAVRQAISAVELRRNMNIQANVETAAKNATPIAQKIVVMES